MATQSNKFKLLAFDPGLTTTGYSLLEGSLDSPDITVIKLGSIHPGPVVDRKEYREDVEKFDKRVITLSYLREQVKKLVAELKPDVIVAEDIFINPKRPQAYGALCMWLSTVRMTCRDNFQKYVVAIPTKICKKVLSGRGDSVKQTIQDCVRANTHIKFKFEEDMMQMTEHQADSIAVANALFLMYHDIIEKEVEARNEQQAKTK